MAGVLLGMALLGSVHAQPATQNAAPRTLTASDVRTDGFGSWKFGSTDKGLEKDTTCEKLQGGSPAAFTWVCTAPVQRGTVPTQQGIHLNFEKGLLQEVMFVVKIVDPDSQAAWKIMATSMWAFLQDTCPGQALRAKADEGLRFSEKPTVEAAATIIGQFKDKRLSHIVLSCASGKNKLWLDFDRMTFFHRAAAIR